MCITMMAICSVFAYIKMEKLYPKIHAWAKSHGYQISDKFEQAMFGQCIFQTTDGDIEIRAYIGRPRNPTLMLDASIYLGEGASNGSTRKWLEHGEISI